MLFGQVVSGETSLLFAEEEEKSVQDAVANLVRKWKGFSKMYYGALNYIPAIAVGGHLVQWQLLSSRGQVTSWIYWQTFITPMVRLHWEKHTPSSPMGRLCTFEPDHVFVLLFSIQERNKKPVSFVPIVNSEIVPLWYCIDLRMKQDYHSHCFSKG